MKTLRLVLAISALVFTIASGAHAQLGPPPVGSSSSGGTGSGTVSGQAVNAIPVGGSATSITSTVCTPPATNGTYNINYVVTASAAVAPGCPEVGITPDQAAAAAVTSADCAVGVLYNPAAALSLPTPTTLANPNCALTIINNGAASTITPTTWTISLNGGTAGATAVVPTKAKCSLVIDQVASTQWDVDCTTIGTASSAWSAITAGSNVQTGAFSTAAPWTYSAAGAVSTPAITLSGQPLITGGTGTTTLPLFYLNTGSAPTTWNTAGTYIGVNAVSGFTGNFIDFHLNGGSSAFKVAQNGNLTSTGQLSGTTLTFGTALADGNNGHTVISASTPTILTSGCGGTGATISNFNTTAAFTIGIGTSNTGTCTVTMPGASTGWVCFATDLTTKSTNQATVLETSASTSTSLVLQNYTDAMVTHAMTDSDTLIVSCHAY